MLNVTQMSMPYSQKHIEGKHKVFMGDFQTRKEAESALPEVREKVNKDAFISVIEDEKKPIVLDPKAKMQQAILMAQAKAITKAKVDETKPEEEISVDTNTTVEPPKVTQEKEAVQKTESVKKKEKTVVAMKEDVKAEEIFCKPTKKALREVEIAEALEFYRNSSFYSFKD